MTRDEARAFAAEWAQAWNERAVEKVLAHFHRDVVFRSPTALAVLGTPVVRGKEALRAYWTTALGRIGSLRFTVDRVLVGPRATRARDRVHVRDRRKRQEGVGEPQLRRQRRDRVG